MSDHVSPAKRSQIMSRVRSKDTSPELLVRRLVFSLGYRYRLHDKKLPGKPDLVFASRKKVIFVHGCFWHFHGCKKGMPPKSNLHYWMQKLLDNQTRDARAYQALNDAGWQYLVVWQCQLRRLEELPAVLSEFLR